MRQIKTEIFGFGSNNARAMDRTIYLSNFVVKPSDIYSVNIYSHCDNFCTLKVDTTTLLNHVYNHVGADTTQFYDGTYLLENYNFTDSSFIYLRVDDDYRWDPVVAYAYSFEFLIKSH